MNIKGQGHSSTFIQGHSDSTFSNFFCSETTRPIEAKFHMEPPQDVRDENLFKCSRSDDCPYMVKNFKNLLPNQEADDFETWYTASGTRVLLMFSYDDPGLTLTILMTVSSFVSKCFCAWVKAYTALSALVFPSLF